MGGSKRDREGKIIGSGHFFFFFLKHKQALNGLFLATGSPPNRVDPRDPSLQRELMRELRKTGASSQIVNLPSRLARTDRFLRSRH